MEHDNKQVEIMNRSSAKRRDLSRYPCFWGKLSLILDICQGISAESKEHVARKKQKDGGRKTEDREQMSEVGDRRTEGKD